MPALSISRILTGIDKPFAVGLGQLFNFPEVTIVAVPFGRQKRVQSMVEIIAPLGIQAVSAQLSAANDS